MMTARLGLPVMVIVAGVSWTATAQQPQTPSSTSSPQSLQSPPVPNTSKQQSAQHDQEAAGNAAVQHGANEPPHDQSGSGDGSHGDDGKRVSHFGLYTPEEVTAAFTIALAVATLFLVAATIVLAVATIGLYRQTKRLAEQAVAASRDTKAALEIANRAAAAAKQSADVAEVGLVSVDAPYVQTSIQLVAPDPACGRPVHRNCISVAQITFTNYGRTPAFIRGFHVEFYVPGTAPPVSHCDYGGSQNLSNTVILSNESEMLHEIPLTKAIIDQTQEGNPGPGSWILYIRGYVRYESLSGAHYASDIMHHVQTLRSETFHMPGRQFNCRHRLTDDEIENLPPRPQPAG